METLFPSNNKNIECKNKLFFTKLKEDDFTMNNEIIGNLNSKDFCNSVANLADTAIVLYKIKDLYMKVREALNQMWENIIDICDWFNKTYADKYTNVEKENYIPFVKSLLARNDYDVDYICENVNFMYGSNAFDDFCKSVFILNELER